ncbi:MAG: hypothetical protein MR499_11335 [Lachnospiraceae bacterium]|nr:hypothetical protein [Lachnospiraceae bacterium]
MNDEFVIDTLAMYFKEEISNKVKVGDDGIIVRFDNGKSAIVKAIIVS